MRAKRALPAPPLSAQDVRYRPPRGRRHGPILTREELSWARHAVAETILRRVRTGEPVPQSLHQLLARLTDLLEIGLPAGFVDGTESGSDVGQLDEWIDTAETAGLMGCTPEYVRRIAEELGGQRRGRQWFIPRRNIIEHLNGREAS